MKYRLGIDLGTASLGTARITLDDEANPVDLDGRVLIFSEPLEPAKQGGVGAPKKATRREKRSARRLIDRRKRDIRWIRNLYPALGITDADMQDGEIFRANSVQNIHELRAKAAKDPVTVPGLIRVLGKMKKRRGYKGRFRETSKPGEVQEGIQRVQMEMDAQGCKTLGEYLLWRHQQGLTLKLKEADPKLYIHRSMTDAEFNQIWSVQSAYHEQFQSEYDGRPFRQWFYDYVFYQRPLRSPAPMVGKCDLEPTHPRAPRAQPVFQEFRIQKTLNDLAWSDKSPLEEKVRSLIGEMLRDPKVLDSHGFLTFKKIYRELNSRNWIPAEGLYLNLDEPPRTGLKGDTTRKVMAKLELLDAWDALDSKVQLQIINLLADMGSPEVFEDPDWVEQLRTPSGKKRNLYPETIEFINRMVECPKFGRLSSMGMDAGRADYSIKAMQKLLPLLQSGMNESDARDQAYPGWRMVKGEQDALKAKLEPHSATGNVSVDCALNNLRSEINRLIEQHGLPSEIIVEMTRDMRLGRSKRDEIARQIASNERDRKRISKELTDHNYPASSRNILRYQLWEEQDHRCPFCAEEGIGLDDALNGNETNIEHIIPFQLSRVGKQRSKLVLAHRGCNDDKKMRTPWQAWGHDEERWHIIEQRAKQFEEKKLYGKSRQLLLKDFEEEVLTDDVIAGFSERQYHESGWIAKLAVEWLKSVCPRVFVTRGTLTAHLRRIWGLDSVIPEVRFGEGLPVLDEAGNPLKPEDLHDGKARPDKRLDHRHHLIDAIAIGFSTPGIFNKMARHYKRVSEHTPEGKAPKLRLNVDPPMADLRDRARELIESCPVHHKPDRYPDGQLFEDTAYRLIEVEEDDEIVQKLASRKKLADAGGSGATEKSIRNFVASIAYPVARQTIEKEVERRLSSGIKPANVFDDPILHPLYKTPIRRVFCFSDQPGEFTSVLMKKDAPADAIQASPNAYLKYLKHAGFAYVEINPETNEKRLVPVAAALQQKGSPVPDGFIRICKNDTIIHPRDGKRYVVRQIKSETEGTLMCTLVSETRPVRELNTKSGLKKISGKTVCKLQLADE